MSVSLCASLQCHECFHIRKSLFSHDGRVGRRLGLYVRVMLVMNSLMNLPIIKGMKCLKMYAGHQ